MWIFLLTNFNTTFRLYKQSSSGVIESIVTIINYNNNTTTQIEIKKTNKKISSKPKSTNQFLNWLEQINTSTTIQIVLVHYQYTIQQQHKCMQYNYDTLLYHHVCICCHWYMIFFTVFQQTLGLTRISDMTTYNIEYIYTRYDKMTWWIRYQWYSIT